ncbi:hypothetical protein CPC735_038100 [Coccidioides posadasii C735 delta SOWgp]|uniref:Integral membrane protein n=3 Tax=Coccidioides posadasii TaxID=199306 RepID=E9CRN8_COCPS|nr:hypothetical protein CPC735_038100 [Coccidioides posadasii C735 delta SOWgp]EER29104.1 hypothetical protein CPC735_038100 [Coccidioides posadasii C735 delta SOWgp]EFW22465.1 conserved hypothetical protein [Coccidioides posadasii str. Silveira]KMM63922.1 hypothetical protein CPAG_00275 [Coccidioides posadasii RMSCC 3488]|eukprot:XP_003071249.1 hypothetical protein CPC735_038100 [Coccidioides posadasii C735 delta SOWgp]
MRLPLSGLQFSFLSLPNTSGLVRKQATSTTQKMSPSGIPSLYEILQLGIRATVLVGSLAVLALMIFVRVKFVTIDTWSIAAVCWCICVDTAEVFRLLSTGRRTNVPWLSVTAMITLDLISVIFLTGAILATLFSDLSHSRVERTRAQIGWCLVVFWCQIALAGYHFMLVMLHCFHRCKYGTELS